ncbi:MAG TPA: UDP-N-acetylglucosamine 2-epimerase (non-hydrolyzing) [Candidatus Cryptobacteroides excrementigallinarum]|nr:UDP-N-acetylglucosamine 2-epimerase (non-hydrolyzing) [Candidatus Cryptobacteroides excrementigallinarum]
MASFKNNGKLKLLIIVGTRPEIIRLAAVITKCRKYFDCLLAHTGQNYDYNLNGVFFKDLKLADPEVYMDAVGDDLGATMGNIIDRSYKLMVRTQPDAVLVLGDTNSCLSVIGAKRLHIPIFHMEAGNRCKDECLPEETNRRIVDIISDVNLCYSEHARRYLIECGLPKERTYVTGSPMAEVLRANLAEIEASDVHARLGLEKGRYILLSAHREENIDTEKNFRSLFGAINAMAEKYDMPVLYSCHPRSRKRLEASGFRLDSRVIRHEPLGFHDYNCLQMNAFAVVSDSGTLPEESSFFTSVGRPFPAVCIRTSTERPEALDKGCFILAGIDERSLLQAVDTAVRMNADGDFGVPVPDYVEENVSAKVVKIIQSYTGVVNKMVWRKY